MLEDHSHMANENFALLQTMFRESRTTGQLLLNNALVYAICGAVMNDVPDTTNLRV